MCAFQLWVQERLPLATSQETGSSLQAVQQLMKKNQVKLHIPHPWFILRYIYEESSVPCRIQVVCFVSVVTARTNLNLGSFLNGPDFSSIPQTLTMQLPPEWNTAPVSNTVQWRITLTDFSTFLAQHVSPLQSLQRDLESHRGHVEEVMERASVFSAVRTAEAACVRVLMEDLHSLWGALWAETERKQVHLDSMYQAQQYYSDITEVEAWLSEQELHMMNEEIGKVEQEQ